MRLSGQCNPQTASVWSTGSGCPSRGLPLRWLRPKPGFWICAAGPERGTPAAADPRWETEKATLEAKGPTCRVLRPFRHKGFVNRGRMRPCASLPVAGRDMVLCLCVCVCVQKMASVYLKSGFSQLLLKGWGCLPGSAALRSFQL